MHPYSHLLEPLKVGGLTLKNRMLSAPTSLAELGAGEHYSEDNIAYYKLKASGGCALVTVGDVIVDNGTGRSHPQQVGLNDEGNIPYLTKLADAIHSGGAAASVEIDHGGGLCDPLFLGGRNAIGPSSYVDEWGDVVEEITAAQMEEIADAFGRAAAMVKQCGFDMVMVHCGHGWLLHQFLSPITNKRTDEYGGSIANRMRFPLMVVEKVRRAVGRNFPIDVRISGSERVEGGYDLDTGIEIAKMLDGKVDLIHVSAGTQYDEYSAVLMHPGIYQQHGENSYLAKEIRKHVKTPVCTVGAFSEPDKMEAFLAEGGADCIAMGRALIADPFLPKKVMRDQISDITTCVRCGECQSGMMKNRCMRCTVNPLIGRENEYFHPIPVRNKRKVLIAGGGPGGMQAALAACERGHEVVLCEASDRLGGALSFADGADFKRSMRAYRESQAEKVMRLPIKVCLNTKADAAVIAKEQPDALIIATGARPFLPPIDGLAEALGSGRMLFGADVMEDMPLGDRVVIIGGGLIGCETGVHTARMGHDTTILEMNESPASDCGRMHKLNLDHQMAVLDNLYVACSHTCTRIDGEGVWARDADGKEKLFAADTMILAAGLMPDNEAADALRGLVPESYVIGDAMRAGKVGNATRDAYDAAVNLGLY